MHRPVQQQTSAEKDVAVAVVVALSAGVQASASKQSRFHPLAEICEENNFPSHVERTWSLMTKKSK